MSDPTRDLEAEQSKRPSTFTPICVDAECSDCGEQPRLRVCADCDAYGLVTDCGHRAQPRPIAAGRCNGSELGSDYCATCAWGDTEVPFDVYADGVTEEDMVEDIGIHCGEQTPGPNYEPDPDMDGTK